MYAFEHEFQRQGALNLQNEILETNIERWQGNTLQISKV